VNRSFKNIFSSKQTCNLSVGGDGRHGDGGEHRDQVGKTNDRHSLPDSGLPNNPREAEEQHGAPNVEQATHQHTLHPAKLDNL
jgi:hypothetical protein